MTESVWARHLHEVPLPWSAVLPPVFARAAAEVAQRVRQISGGRPVAPDDPWRALRVLAPHDVKVVVLGQDPYPTAGHADGLAFSCARGRPASLRRIFAVLSADRPGFVPPPHSRLDHWASQGVLLLNTVLTVEVGRVGSHFNLGWEALTSQILLYLSSRDPPPVFLLWGSKAQAFFDQALPDARAASVLRTRHPANDFTRGFMAEGSHFVATSHLVNWWQQAP